MHCVAQLMRDCEHRSHVGAPGSEYVWMHIIHRRTEPACGLADIIRPIDPPILKGVTHYLGVLGAHYLDCFLDKPAPFFIRDVRPKARVKRCLDIAVHHLVQAQDPLAQFHVSTHMRGQPGLDCAHQVVVELFRDFLLMQEHVSCGLVPPDSRHGHVLLDLGPKSTPERVLITLQPFGER